MIDPRAKYESALAAFAAPGARWANKGALTYWGKAAGMTDDEIVADAHAAGVTDRDADIRRGWADARPRGDRPQGFGFGRRAAPLARPRQEPPQTFPRFVRDMVAAGGGMGDCGSDAVRELSPCLDWFGTPPPPNQTAMFMRAAFAPGEMVHVFRDDVPTVGRPGANIRPAADWVELIGRGEPLPGDLLVPNPFTGERGETTAGKQSFIAQSCLAAFPFMVLEFDEMPLAKQCAFWRAFILTSRLAPALVALTFSGNRSIHGLVHVGCAALADWQAVRQRMRGLFASDPDATMRADVQAMQPRTGTRLPGVRRFDNGRRQTLLYLNPRARPGNMWREPIAEPSPTGAPTPIVRTEPRERPCTRPDGRTGKDAPEAGGCVTGRISASPCDCAPLPPTMPPDNAPLDDLLAAMDVAEAWEAAGNPPAGFPETRAGCARPLLS